MLEDPEQPIEDAHSRPGVDGVGAPRRAPPGVGIEAFDAKDHDLMD
jgi:hypothetical protein